MAKEKDLSKLTPVELVALVEKANAETQAAKTALEIVTKERDSAVELVDKLTDELSVKAKFGNQKVVKSSEGQTYLALHGSYRIKSGLTLSAAELVDNQAAIDELVKVNHGGLKKVTL